MFHIIFRRTYKEIITKEKIKKVFWKSLTKYMWKVHDKKIVNVVTRDFKKKNYNLCLNVYVFA